MATLLTSASSFSSNGEKQNQFVYIRMVEIILVLSSF